MILDTRTKACSIPFPFKNSLKLISIGLEASFVDVLLFQLRFVSEPIFPANLHWPTTIVLVRPEKKKGVYSLTIRSQVGLSFP
jgi:hypothetical protein